ncbi:putative ileal sodium/bile acid cotransporter [Apostichopus japonicus]|uniref:Putative ileal sodium/bile acid cotransporter n=1 Tax=Stichopus japonicus TaxID=307972 RepID=A0A2G8KXD1_STIJA|nr:putative ileal sodium/bile acid cotransporter [Apostichopus japonicus]
MLCQFVIMPFTAWSLAKLFQIEGAAAVGLVLDGSCPGGTNSNLFSVLLDVDFVLSITMTFFSTVLALAMMPLNLLIYASSYFCRTMRCVIFPMIGATAGFIISKGISLVIVYTLLKKFYWHGVPYDDDDDDDDTETGQYDVSGDKKKETEQKEEPSRSSVFTISKNDADGDHKEDDFDVVDLGPKVTSAKTNSAYIVD